MTPPPASLEDHLPHEALDEYFAGRVSIGRLGALAVDLLAEHCPECRRRLESAPFSSAEAFAEGEARGRAILADIDRERETLPHVLAPLLSLGPTAALVHVAGDHRCHTVAFVEHELSLAWEAFEQGVSSILDQAWQLAFVALRGLDVGRYGRPLVSKLEAELWLLEARDSVLRGNFDTARASFRAAGSLLREAGRPPDLGGLELLAAAQLALAEERLDRARTIADASRDLLRAVGGERWRLPVERLLARIDRLEGAPRAAADRLLDALERREVLQGAIEWSLAHEAIQALAEGGCAEKAYAWFLVWWGEPSGTDAAARDGASEDRGWRATEETGPRELLTLASVLRALGRQEEAHDLLEAVLRRHLRMGMGREAIVAMVELLRLDLEAGDRDALRRDLAHLEELAACPDVPRAPLRELVRFAAETWRGRVAGLQRVERSLLVRLNNTATGRDHGRG